MNCSLTKILVFVHHTSDATTPCTSLSLVTLVHTTSPCSEANINPKDYSFILKSIEKHKKFKNKNKNKNKDKHKDRSYQQTNDNSVGGPKKDETISPNLKPLNGTKSGITLLGS